MERNELEIRDATSDDLEAIATLEASCFPIPWPLRFFESELRAQGRISRVAVIDDLIAGYLFGMVAFDEMHINKIGIDPAHRRLGIGESLVENALEHARTGRVETVWLELRESNTTARLFYERLGFAREYERKNYYENGETALIMLKRLGPANG